MTEQAPQLRDSEDPVETYVQVRLYDVLRDGEVVERVHLSEADAAKYGDRVRPTPVTEDGELKGQALDDALDAAGLPKSGTADEKRARLAQHAPRG